MITLRSSTVTLRTGIDRRDMIDWKIVGGCVIGIAIGKILIGIVKVIFG